MTQSSFNTGDDLLLHSFSCEIPMGDLQSEEERDIVVEVNMPALRAANEEYPVIKAQLSYFNIITSLMDTVECQLIVNRALSGGFK